MANFRQGDVKRIRLLTVPLGWEAPQHIRSNVCRKLVPQCDRDEGAYSSEEIQHRRANFLRDGLFDSAAHLFLNRSVQNVDN